MKTFFKNNIHFLLIPSVTLIIIFSWFYDGKIISNNSEEDLNIYHSQKFADYYSNFWYPVGTGFKTPFHIVRYPTFFVLGVFEQAGVPAFLRQALLLWFLMIAGMLSMYFLLKKCFRLTLVISLVGSSFYLLNIYSMTQVWKRFLYHGIFAWAYLPLFLFLWIKWVDGKRLIWLILFLLSSLIFTYAFSQPAHLITIWAPAGIFVLVKVWQSRTKTKEIMRTSIKALIGFVLWCFINIWWLYPTLSLGSTWIESTGQTWISDFGSLDAVSKSFPLGQVLLLRQSWYLSPENDFSNYYQSLPIHLISIMVLFFVVLAIFKHKEYPYRGFLLVSAFVGFFISKGTNFPLGHTFFYLLFSNFSPATAFRNSYEKFGIVWLLAYTILFSLGFSRFLSSLKTNKRLILGGITLLLILGILVLPFWTGKVFPQKHRVNVPKYYKDANNYIKQQSDSRIFHIPFLLEGEKLTYSWGYIGEDPSPSLFDLESVTKPKIPIYYKVAALLPKFLNEKQFPKILGILGVENIILHKDNIYPQINPEEVIKNIENWEGIQSKKGIGELSIYSLSKELVKPRVYIATSMVSVPSIEDGLVQVISGKIDTKSEIFTENRTPIIENILTGDLVKINFKKISNDHYLVEIKQVSHPFILVLNNTFDKLWEAKIDRQLLDKHILVNGFANGWFIDRIGDFEVEIKLAIWPWD